LADDLDKGARRAVNSTPVACSSRLRVRPRATIAPNQSLDRRVSAGCACLALDGSPVRPLPPCLSIHQSLHPRFGLAAGFEIEHSRRDTVDRETDLYREAGFLTGPYDAYACHATIVSRGGMRRERHSGARKIGPGRFRPGCRGVGGRLSIFFPPASAAFCSATHCSASALVAKYLRGSTRPPRAVVNPNRAVHILVALDEIVFLAPSVSCDAPSVRELAVRALFKLRRYRSAGQWSGSSAASIAARRSTIACASC
jgi:hypothetical protein